jgi:hypothetical protein
VLGYDVQEGVVLGGGEEVAVPFAEYFIGVAAGMVLFEGADGGLKISGVCQEIRPSGSQFGQLEMTLVQSPATSPRERPILHQNTT